MSQLPGAFALPSLPPKKTPYLSHLLRQLQAAKMGTGLSVNWLENGWCLFIALMGWKGDPRVCGTKQCRAEIEAAELCKTRVKVRCLGVFLSACLLLSSYSAIFPHGFDFELVSPTLGNMARTRQTSKKTTGGKAPRKALGGAVAEPTPPKGEAWHSNNENGNKDSLTYVQLTVVLCLYEWWTVCAVNKVPMTYRGLYSKDGCAMFSNGLAITPQSFIPPRIRCRLPRLCIINIYLVVLLPRGGPGHFLSEMVCPWYSLFRDESRVTYLEHIMDVTGDRTIDNGVADMAELCYDMIMVFICTHSDETRGDLSLGWMVLSRSMMYHLLDLLKKKEITMFLLACGAILHHKESSHDLKTAVSVFNIKNCFAFTSQMLLAYKIFPFVQGYAHAVVRQGRDSEADFEQLLDQLPQRWLAHQYCMVHAGRMKVNQNGSILFGWKGKLPSSAKCQATVTVINDMNLGPMQRGHKGVWMKGIL
ncbi:hypothetical protein BC835DRAFT_1310641 [Cytidiella melzeri]|nr:hypothetical protein BC835DRAFT_1310641 [Cytidiella melzeri]